MCSWEKTGVVGDDGHFCAIIARLVKHPLRKHHKYIWILFEPGIELPVVVLRLWGGTIKSLSDLSPVLS